MQNVAAPFNVLSAKGGHVRTEKQQPTTPQKKCVAAPSVAAAIAEPNNKSKESKANPKESKVNTCKYVTTFLEHNLNITIVNYKHNKIYWNAECGCAV